MQGTLDRPVEPGVNALSCDGDNATIAPPVRPEIRVGHVHACKQRMRIGVDGHHDVRLVDVAAGLVGQGFAARAAAFSPGLPFSAIVRGCETVFSVIAWAVFAALLIGKKVWNWRGKRAMRWALSGYALLLISYFGSKLVLEQVLNRHW